MSERPRLRVALPGLAAAVAECIARGAQPRLPAAEWLLARADRTRGAACAWREWLLVGAPLGTEVLQRFPAGPCSGFAWTGRLPQGCWACAVPVHLLTALDHLQLAAPAPLPVTAEEEAELLAALNAHLAATGFRLQDGGGHGWLLQCPEGLECTASEPARAIGCNLREHLPEGRDAARVRAMVNELQMLLHEHPVNVARESRGLPTVNSVWVWGFGTVAAAQCTVAGPLVTDDAWLAGLWGLHGGVVRSVAELEAALGAGSGVVRVGLAPRLDGMTAEQELQWLERSVFEPLRMALRAGTIGRVELLTDETLFAAGRVARLRFWRRARPLAGQLP